MKLTRKDAIPAQDRLVGGHFVKLTQGRVVEAEPVKNARPYSGNHGEETDVDDFGGLLADNVHAEQSHVFPAKD
jgi:hypothetical protein